MLPAIPALRFPTDSHTLAQDLPHRCSRRRNGRLQSEKVVEAQLPATAKGTGAVPQLRDGSPGSERKSTQTWAGAGRGGPCSGQKKPSNQQTATKKTPRPRAKARAAEPKHQTRAGASPARKQRGGVQRPRRGGLHGVGGGHGGCWDVSKVVSLVDFKEPSSRRSTPISRPVPTSFSRLESPRRWSETRRTRSWSQGMS